MELESWRGGGTTRTCSGSLPYAHLAVAGGQLANSVNNCVTGWAEAVRKDGNREFGFVLFLIIYVVLFLLFCCSYACALVSFTHSLL